MTAFLAFLGVALFVLVGLVVDGGRALAARRQAMDIAEQAARIGADQLSVDALRQGSFIIDPVAATNAVDADLLSSGVTGTVSVSGDSVTVAVHSVCTTTILEIVGVQSIAVSGTAVATDVHGVTREDA